MSSHYLLNGQQEPIREHYPTYNGTYNLQCSTMSRSSNQKKEELVLEEHAKSVAGAPLPLLASGQGHEHAGTILLFYQYQEPIWTAKQHKQVLKDVIALGQKHNITGRGRVAPEGLNCTLSGNPNNVRAFCQGLRDYDKLFLKTDFKLTDGVPLSKLFKSLSIRKTNELVAYGLSGEKAPLLSKFAGEHLTAQDYHTAMASDNTVIIDVRNAYESAIGNFCPPPGGAELIDPQMRNSIEFPNWLADEQTQKKLHGKKVLMYCTGK
jgi:predicted sulfurtransferase